MAKSRIQQLRDELRKENRTFYKLRWYEQEPFQTRREWYANHKDLRNAVHWYGISKDDAKVINLQLIEVKYENCERTETVLI